LPNPTKSDTNPTESIALRRSCAQRSRRIIRWHAVRNQERMMRSENIPTPASPEQPPLAPHDPPEPAPQAAAWRRALRVIGHTPPKDYRMGRTTVIKTTIRKG
jgi:hypothetical protein